MHDNLDRSSLHGLLRMPGAEIKMAHGQEDRNPVVLGRLGRDPSKPTVCFYGGPPGCVCCCREPPCGCAVVW